MTEIIPEVAVFPLNALFKAKNNNTNVIRKMEIKTRVDSSIAFSKSLTFIESALAKPTDAIRRNAKEIPNNSLFILLLGKLFL